MHRMKAVGGLLSLLLMLACVVYLAMGEGDGGTNRLNRPPESGMFSMSRPGAATKKPTIASSRSVQATPVGRSYYVSADGTDSKNGSITKPFRTLAKGVSVLKPGDTLFVRGGTYLASSQLGDIPSGSSWSAPVTVRAYPNEIVTLVAEPGYQVLYFNNGNHHIIIDGFIIEAKGAVNGVKITYNSTGAGSHHIRIINSEIKNATYSGILTAGKSFGVGSNEFIDCSVHDNGTRQSFDHGIYLECDNELVDGCEIYNNAAYGIHIWEDDASNITVRNCLVYSHEGAAGILIGTGNGHKIYNNVVYSNSWGIAIFYGGGGAVFNNTVCENVIGIYVCCRAASSTIDNNIVFSNVGAGIYIEDGTVAEQTCRNNLSSHNGGGDLVDKFNRATGTNNLLGAQYDPKFVDPASHDYRLGAESSALDSGLTIEQLTTDALGKSRPKGIALDIGAYERKPKRVKQP